MSDMRAILIVRGVGEVAAGTDGEVADVRAGGAMLRLRGAAMLI